MSLPSVIVETGPEPLGSVIWLHGLGADGHDFEAIVPELRLPAAAPLRFVFPHAPERPVTVNGGMRMRAWYDIRSLDAAGMADEEGILESSRLLGELISQELQIGMDLSQIVLAGFSQGGAIVLHHALSTGVAVAGIMALSTYVALPQRLRAAAAADADAPRIFMAHGTLDNVVPYDAGRRSSTFIRELGFHLEWHDYAMGHGVCGDEVRDIRNWLLQVLAPAQVASR